MTISLLNKALAEVTQKVILLENHPDELRQYLDFLEESIIEVPYGDMLHDHACELALAIMQKKTNY